ncbi:MAG: PD40 domain-containing protein [Fimbriimonadaceae bacterium]|nr:PD40 domain-containing protein [Fimbriimonadaceae bacterium]QYK58458.1 MAG: PD40 domain-containing protein [Fimbriimonadaceae bacterium]
MLVSILASVALATGAEAPKLLRFPDVHGDTIAFVYASDIWTADLNGGFARRLTTHPGSESSPRFSPDGKWIAFTAQYDSGLPQVYVIPAEGGTPKRLTFEPKPFSVTGWTPDGKIVCASSYGSAFTPRLWLVDPNRGMLQRTDLGEFTNGSYSPDGKQIAFNRNNSYAFNWRLYRGGTQGRIAFWDFESKKYWEAPAGREQNYWPMWIGDKVYYLSDKADKNLNLWSYDTGTKRQTQLTQFKDGDIKNPQFDSKTIVFERNGGLFAFDVASGKVNELSPLIRGDLINARPRYRRFGDSVQGFALSPSGKRVVVEARGQLYSVPATQGETRPLASSKSRDTSPSWSPDGQTIAFLSDRTGDWAIYTVPQMGGEPKMIKTPASDKIRRFGWFPNSKKIGYTTVDSAVSIVDLESGNIEKVFQNPSGGLSMDFSQDGSWIAYLKTQPNFMEAVYLYNVRDKKHHKVTEGYYGDAGVAFDLTGKYLYIVSNRTFGSSFDAFQGPSLFQQNVQRVYALMLTKGQTNPLIPPSDEEPEVKQVEAKAPDTKPEDKPAQGEKKEPEAMKIDLDGLDQRMIALPWPPGSYPILVGVENGVLTIANGNLVKFDMNSRQPQTILPNAGFALSFNAKRTKFAYSTGGGVAIADVRPGVEPGSGRVNVGDIGRQWDPMAEWEQIYWEAWRHQRDLFYDKNMLGLDWDAVGKKYAALLPYVAHRNDLNYLLGLMIGELGTGHAYITSPGDTGFQPQSVPVGQLGADYRVVGDKIQFAKIYRGLNFEEPRRGPLGAPGIEVKDGEYLLAINGEPVDAKTGVHQFLVDKVEKAVKLTVNDSPTMAGSREIVVRPIGDESDLRYIDWVEGNRRTVREKSGGRIGYLHVPNTSVQGIIEFLKGFYSNSDAEAWIIDERYNGGGFIPTFFIEALQRQMQTMFVPRYGENVPMPSQSLQGPMVMLINEFAGSGGDMLPWLFKRNKLGPLIGTRTWGGLVGIQGGVPLVDGGSVTTPGFGIFDTQTGELIAENKGVDPDIEVDARPDLVAQGRDPVLERAMEHVTKQLPKEKRRLPAPIFPKFGQP